MSRTIYILLVASFLVGGLVGFAGFPANRSGSETSPSIP